MKSSCVPGYITQPAEIVGLRRAGYREAHKTWGAFMLESLVRDARVDDVRRLFGIGAD